MVIGRHEVVKSAGGNDRDQDEGEQTEQKAEDESEGSLVASDARRHLTKRTVPCPHQLQECIVR